MLTYFVRLVLLFPVFTVSAITMRRTRSPLHLHRPAARRAVGAGRGAERCVRAAAAPAVSRDRRLLAAAGGLQLPRRRGLDPEGLSRPRAPDHDGCLVLSAPVHVHQVRHRRGRRHKLPRLERRDLGDRTRVDPGRDLLVVEHTPIDYLDFASPESGLGGKLGFDATDKWPPETKREWGRKLRMAERWWRR